MPLYLNELAPWERKNEYFSKIELGKDIKEQAQAVAAATNQLVAAQLATANSIVASQEYIRETISSGVNKIACGIDGVKQGLEGMQSSFEFGISEVVWQLEQNRQSLRDILDVLSAPLDTQSKELRRRAEDAYANGWIEDALEDFKASEDKNKYDFTIHISLGMLYLYHVKDKETALRYFDKAIKYARPKSKYHFSYALLYKSIILRESGNIDDAMKCTAEAVASSPEFSEAYYQNAINEALLGMIPDSLFRATRIDSKYLLKAYNDEYFESSVPFLNNVARVLADEARVKYVAAKGDIEKTRQGLLDLFEKTIRLDSSLERLRNDFQSDYGKLSCKCDQVEKANALLDYNNFCQAVYSDAIGMIRSHKDALKRAFSSAKDRICSTNDKKFYKELSRRDDISNIPGAIGFWGSAIGGLWWLSIVTDFSSSRQSVSAGSVFIAILILDCACYAWYLYRKANNSHAITQLQSHCAVSEDTYNAVQKLF